MQIYIDKDKYTFFPDFFGMNIRITGMNILYYSSQLSYYLGQHVYHYLKKYNIIRYNSLSFGHLPYYS